MSIGLLILALIGSCLASSLDCSDHPYGKSATFSYPLLNRRICGLNNPRGLTATSDVVFVPEAGNGGNFGNPAACRFVAESATTYCSGFSGSIIQRKNGKNSRVLTGLPSAAEVAVCQPGDAGYIPAGNNALGLHGLSVRGDRVYGVETFFPNDPTGTAGKLLEFSGFKLQSSVMDPRIVEILSKSRPRPVAFRPVADIAGYEFANNPDGAQLDSNPYGVVSLPNGEVFVSDAAANDVLRLANGQLSVVATFAAQSTPGDIASCKPTYEGVPTRVAYNPRDGNVYVGQLTGFPYPQGAANVYKIARTKGAAADGSQDTFAQSTYATGFTMITGIAFDEFGNLYVLEFSNLGAGPKAACTGPPPASSCTDPVPPAFPNWCAQPAISFGALWQVKPTGEKTLLIGPPNCQVNPPVITHEPLIFPGGLAYKKKGDLYISNRSTSPGVGEVVKFDVSKYQ